MKTSFITEDLIKKYTEMGYWDNTTIVDDVKRNALKYPDDEAIVDAEVRLNWRDVDKLTDRLALSLYDLGIKRDQVIIVQLPNIAEHYLFVIALRKAGIIGLCPPMTYRHMEMGHAFSFLEAVGVVVAGENKSFNYYNMVKELSQDAPNLKHIFVTGDNVPNDAISVSKLLEEPFEEKYDPDILESLRFGPWDTSLLMSTSGTTGLPKFVHLAEAPLKTSGMGVIKQTNATKDDVIGVLAVMTGAPGQLGWKAAPQIAAKCILIDQQDNDKILSIIEKERISILLSVPTQVFRLIKHPTLNNYDLSSLKVVRTGGAPLDKSVALEVEDKLGCKIAISGGSSEVRGFGYTTVNDPTDVRTGTLGKPPYGNKIMICDDNGNELKKGEIGELWVTGAEMSQGYYKNEEATKESFVQKGEEIWYRTGDNAKINETGNLIVMGRIKDMILRGGQNIFPKEIEDILINHPKVRHVAIVAMPDREYGEKACAYIVPEQGTEFTMDEMISYLSHKKLSKFKFPERLELIEKLPVVSDIQKTDKKALRIDVEQKLKKEGKI